MKILFTLLWLLLSPLPALASSFQEINGVYWLYTTDEGIRFRDVQSELDSLHQRGYRMLAIYSPYHGDKAKWMGCDPLDFYNVTPSSGTLADFRALVAAAHARGIKVAAYFTNIFIDRKSDFFQTALRQYAAGDRTSREVSAIRWSTDSSIPKNPDDKPFQDPEGEEPKWLYSKAAKAHYWSIWGEAAFDYSLAGAKAEGERIMKFWLDTGLDGFIFDAGVIDPKLKPVMVDIVKSYTSNDKWITFESTEAELDKDYDRFGLTSWFNFEDNDHVNDYARVVRGLINMNELENALKRSDYARSLGKTTHAFAKADENEDPTAEEEEDDEEKEEKKPYVNPPLMRVQEAALLAGAGVLYGTPNKTSLEQWPAETVRKWESVLASVNANPALLPSASRVRVRADGNKQYAMLRLSKNGRQKALLAYNFSASPVKAKLDLNGTGLSLSQQPRNLYPDGFSPAPIRGAQYVVDIPAWGFRFLEVQ